MPFANDEELFTTIQDTLYTPVVGDVLDALGCRHQFLPQAIQPMRDNMRLAGRAMPVQIADAWGRQKDPFGRMTEALDQIFPSEIYIVTGGSMNCAAWGEVMTATARMRKGSGAVIDGFHRDTPPRSGTELARIQSREVCPRCWRPIQGRRLPMFH